MEMYSILAWGADQAAPSTRTVSESKPRDLHRAPRSRQAGFLPSRGGPSKELRASRHAVATLEGEIEALAGGIKALACWTPSPRGGMVSRLWRRAPMCGTSRWRIRRMSSHR